MRSREPDNKLPHVTSSGGTPIPKKDKPDSVRIAPAIPNATVINTEVKAFGRACLNIMRTSEKPNACDASINSRLRTFNNSPRT